MTTLILPHAIAPPDDEYMRSNVRVPGTLRRGLQFCNFWSQSFAQGSHFKLQTRQQVAQLTRDHGSPSNVDWLTWNSLVKSPGAPGRNWAIDNFDSASKAHLGGSFHFEIKTKVISEGCSEIKAYTSTELSQSQESSQKYCTEVNLPDA